MMCKRIWMMVALLILVQGTVRAQTQPAYAHPPGKHPIVAGAAQKSNIHSVNVRLRQQMRQTRKDLASGKITREQAQVLWEKFRSVRRQELEFFRQNGRKDITGDQTAQINSSLDQASK